MDKDLREFERRSVGGDSSARRALRQRRARAGQGLGSAALLKELAAAEQRLFAARGEYAQSMVEALRAFLAACFAEHPGLEEVRVYWRQQPSRSTPWQIGLRVGEEVGHYASYGGRIAAEAQLLGLAHLFASHYSYAGARILRREGDVVQVQDCDPRDGGADPDHEVPMRLVEDLSQALRTLRDSYDVGASIEISADPSAKAAAELADQAESDLERAQREFLNEGEWIWEELVPALFLEHPELNDVLVEGYVSGYNDNWYDEHDQEVFCGEHGVGWLEEDLREDPRPVLARVLAGMRKPYGPRCKPVEEALGAARTFTRMRFGARWGLWLRREASEEITAELLEPLWIHEERP